MRRLKPHKRLEQLTRRADSELAWASDEPLIGGALILDTSVYLDVLQARTPDAVGGISSPASGSIQRKVPDCPRGIALTVVRTRAVAASQRAG